MGDKNIYDLRVRVNNRVFNQVVIDQHYKIKHSELNDELILNLVMKIHNGNYHVEEEKDGFSYMTMEPVFYGDLPFKLIVTFYDEDDYLGIVNAYRIRRKK